MPKANRPRSVSRLLETPGLTALAGRASAGRTPDRDGVAPIDLLPEALRGHVHAILEPGRLVLLAENSSVAQLLRFHGPKLARRLGAPKWEVRVAPLPDPGQRGHAANAAPRMPAMAEKCLRETAASVKDPGLSAALEKLADNARGSR